MGSLAMIDLGHGSGAKMAPPIFSDHVNAVIDAGILARRSKQEVRNYLGASLLGDPCSRRLVYIATNTPTDEPLSARSIRIFDTGQAAEDFIVGGTDESEAVFGAVAARWFHDAGFNLRTRNSKGEQFGWETLGGKIKGHIDGVILDGPTIPDLRYPALFECKSANKKNWSKFKKMGVVIASPVYGGQAQLNMAYLDVPQTVFTIMNKDTQELDHQLVNFDPAVAQRLSDRALEIVTMASKGELPDRIASNPDFWICKSTCTGKFYRRCWGTT